MKSSPHNALHSSSYMDYIQLAYVSVHHSQWSVAQALASLCAVSLSYVPLCNAHFQDHSQGMS